MVKKLIYIGQNTDLAGKIKDYLQVKGFEVDFFQELDTATDHLKNGLYGAIIDLRNHTKYSQLDLLKETYDKIYFLRNKKAFPILGILSETEEIDYIKKSNQNNLLISYSPVDKRDIDKFINYISIFK